MVLLGFTLLNYFNVLSLSEMFPSAFGWLPVQNKDTSSLNQTDGPTPRSEEEIMFDPQGDPKAEKGELVKSYVVLYTLTGRITKIAPSTTPDKYDIELTSTTGSQRYEMKGVGGEGVLKGNRPNVEWSDVTPGMEAIINVSVTSQGDKITTGVSQVFITIPN